MFLFSVFSYFVCFVLVLCDIITINGGCDGFFFQLTEVLFSPLIGLDCIFFGGCCYYLIFWLRGFGLFLVDSDLRLKFENFSDMGFDFNIGICLICLL
jgi:putative component of membrane protein insertase Oxa1/YidC/SpoIIIJ protein YidD